MCLVTATLSRNKFYLHQLFAVGAQVQVKNFSKIIVKNVYIEIL